MSKVWLITGCSRGLGRAFAEAALANGDQVAATARKVADLLLSKHFLQFDNQPWQKRRRHFLFGSEPLD